ncbi:hypothetical protein SPBR_01162 [Sporothrix brasiliensis 5110]|uniref:Uncharacterized protein n=1 Tax=Sporothrix brasiliensis 5110 TaxID=1398154 RepID=A0A0C2FGU7_9PEZI|nr:uncharacterized protein SPBR_01162 [Sporothrix brasiliensis 5110]KIH90293.1 hypothetical protein SPBR_01162 [Sporothrix brasiliensis 5110]
MTVETLLQYRYKEDVQRSQDDLRVILEITPLFVELFCGPKDAAEYVEGDVDGDEEGEDLEVDDSEETACDADDVWAL